MKTVAYTIGYDKPLWQETCESLEKIRKIWGYELDNGIVKLYRVNAESIDTCQVTETSSRCCSLGTKGCESSH